MPDSDQPVVSDTETPVVPVDDDKAEFVATGPIFIDGIRAYNENDPVTAAAVKKNALKDFVKKA